MLLIKEIFMIFMSSYFIFSIIIIIVNLKMLLNLQIIVIIKLQGKEYITYALVSFQEI